VRRRSWAELSGGAVAAVALAAGAVALLSGAGGQKSSTGPPSRARPVEAAAAHVAAPRPLSRPGGVSRYAFVDRPVTVRQSPGVHARSLGRLGTRTADRTDELVLALAGWTDRHGVRWMRVRTPLLPTGTVGWIPAAQLSTLRRVRTWVLVDRRARRLTLRRDGRVLLRAPVGIGKAATPTPAGRFYIRDRLTGLPPGSLYGPEAFGTSARSETVTDWPGGSVVGIHGTNQPELIPGRVSHGCIRLRNADILRLARLMPVGTPVTIR
jgi:lipoprotein-anchoring transpeptidase ErfK/SrfK